MAAERTTGGFGSRLREARERRGISVRQIANATKIAASVLEALERNDISRLPGGIFGRAFVRAYAIEVGLDPEDTIREFIAQFPHESVTAGHPTARHVEDTQSLESDRRMASAFIRVVVLSVPVAGMVLYFGLAGRRAMHTAAITPGESVATAVRATSGAESPPAVALADPPPSAAPADRLTVGLLATAPSLVTAAVDGQPAVERQFQAGERQEFEAEHELVLTAGDGSALSVTVNGAEAKPLGRTGEAVTWRLNPANVKDYLATR
jgi:cytoskeletal protein RodZ